MTDPATWLPTVDDVAAIMQARTRQGFVGGGRSSGTFDDTTTPTGDQVEALIANAQTAVLAKVGGKIPASVTAIAKLAVARYAAMDIEASFWPDQLQRDQSPWKAHKAQFESLLADLATAVQQAITDPEQDFGASSEPRVSRGSFPPPSGIGTMVW